MKTFRWTLHALSDLRLREVDAAEAAHTLEHPEYIAQAQPPRLAYMREYYDRTLDKIMLLRIIIEETEFERVVVSVYKTSQRTKYLKNLPKEQP
jgi:hypothetical protein